jgi:type II secretory pathway pseudopilin PulG
MLVVIGVITMLAGLLVPALRQARASARSLSCFSNVRQIAVAHTSYTLDNGRIHPPGNQNWLELIEQYHDGDEARFCPSTVGRGGAAGSDKVGGVRDDWFRGDANEGGSYGANIWVHSTQAGSSVITQHFRRVSEVEQPTLVPVLADSIWHNGAPKDSDTVCSQEPGGSLPAGDMNRMLIRRHFAQVNVGFYDGSAKHVALTRLWSLKWNSTFSIREIVGIPWL